MSDKRSVSTDALETLGTILGKNEKRDAIHLAVIPAEAGELLAPGEYINLKDGIATKNPLGLGIVDPFIPRKAKKGEMFWMVLRPRTITSLRHVWSHPDLPDEPIANPEPKANKEASEAWLRNFCETADCPGYEITIASALGRYVDPDGECSGRNDGEYLHFNGWDAHGEIPPEFWTHVEIVTGKKITNRPTYFSCSC
jgi:hypothetical protein